MSKEESVEIPIHDLFSREIRPLQNWAEWIERWQVAGSMEEMLGLLHVGFAVSLEEVRYSEKKYTYLDRLTFYFAIADGWADSSLLHREGDGHDAYRLGYDEDNNRVLKTKSEVRQVVARKAFSMLCQNFFKLELLNEEETRHNNWWHNLIGSEKIFQLIQNFFRVEEAGVNRYTRIRNLSSGREREKNKNPTEHYAVEFLLTFGKVMWAETRIEPEVQVHVTAAKPWMLEVLAYLQELNILEKWILRLDEVCIAKLKEIALRHEFGVGHRVKTLEEACYLNSASAWLVKKWELMTQTDKRLKAIKAAQRAVDNAQYELKRLTS